MSNKEQLNISDSSFLFEQINYETLIQSLSPIVLLYATNRVYHDYMLQKETKPKYVKINDNFEVEAKNKMVDLKKIAAQKYNYAIMEFVRVMNNKIPKENLNNFYNNINELKIKDNCFSIKNSVFADYDVKRNSIRLFRNDFFTVVYHELLHMASSNYKNKIRYSGFRQTMGSNSIGEGINEGYTQLLTERYFGHVNELKGIYEYEMHMAKKLEEIVGQRKMENMYFNANLKKLVMELSNYSSEDDIKKFIANVDFINVHIKNTNPTPLLKNLLARSIKETNYYLFETYLTKLKYKLDNNEIDSELCQKLVTEFALSLGNTAKVGSIKYETLSVDYITETISQILNNNEKKQVTKYAKNNPKV